MLANSGEAVENKGNERRNWVIMAEVFFFEQKKGKNSGHRQGHTAVIDFR